jgi:hypothetical protein
MARFIANGTRRLKKIDKGVSVTRSYTTAITMERGLLTNAWTADVDTMEPAIRRFTADRQLEHDCHIALFEVAGDTDLHVNVIHSHVRPAVSGWLGPGILPAGCVYNRRFGDTPPSEVLRHIREMVFA